MVGMPLIRATQGAVAEMPTQSYKDIFTACLISRSILYFYFNSKYKVRPELLALSRRNN